MRHPVTGNTTILYDEARRILSAPLNEMLDIVHPSGSFPSADQISGGGSRPEVE